MCVVNWPFAKALLRKIRWPLAGLIEYALTLPAVFSFTEYRWLSDGIERQERRIRAVTTWTASDRHRSGPS